MVLLSVLHTSASPRLKFNAAMAAATLAISGAHCAQLLESPSELPPPPSSSVPTTAAAVEVPLPLRSAPSPPSPRCVSEGVRLVDELAGWMKRSIDEATHEGHLLHQHPQAQHGTPVACHLERALEALGAIDSDAGIFCDGQVAAAHERDLLNWVLRCGVDAAN